ncbi:MAG: histidinol-phosphate transaminase [Pseudomonadota bacterium]
MSKQPEDIIRDEIRALSAYHVPDSVGLVKLDAMENPYALPAEVRAEIAQLAAAAAFNRYPDPGAAQLKARLREVLEIPPGMAVLLGNGSDEIIQMLVMAVAKPGAVVMGVEPSFVMFRMIATVCGVRFAGVPLKADFTLDAERLVAEIAEHQPALIFIAYPNNPTGSLFDAAAMARIIEAAPGLVVVDEAYHAFAGTTFMSRLQDYPNLLVMRTLSKSGLAGLRLGLLAGRDAWLAHVDKVRLPYNINVLTQLVAEQVLRHQALLAGQAAAIKAERARLFEELRRMPGVRPFPSDANFILFKTGAAEQVFNDLKRQGVLIKNLHGSHPALADCLRVTVGTPAENAKFLGVLGKALDT